MNDGMLPGGADSFPGFASPGALPEVFTQSGIFYPKKGAKGYWVTARGAGEGGSTDLSGGKGGRGGAYNERFIPAALVKNPVRVLVGVGGAGGPAGTANVAGLAGGPSSFGDFLLAVGGGPAAAVGPLFGGLGGAGAPGALPFSMGESALFGGGGGGGSTTQGNAGDGGTTGRTSAGGGGKGGVDAVGTGPAGSGGDGKNVGDGGGAGGSNALGSNNQPGAPGGNGAIGGGGGGGGSPGNVNSTRGKGGNGGRGEVVIYPIF